MEEQKISGVTNKDGQFAGAIVGTNIPEKEQEQAWSGRLPDKYFFPRDLMLVATNKKTLLELLESDGTGISPSKYKLYKGDLVKFMFAASKFAFNQSYMRHGIRKVMYNDRKVVCFPGVEDNLTEAALKARQTKKRQLMEDAKEDDRENAIRRVITNPDLDKDDEKAMSDLALRYFDEEKAKTEMRSNEQVKDLEEYLCTIIVPKREFLQEMFGLAKPSRKHSKALADLLRCLNDTFYKDVNPFTGRMETRSLLNFSETESDDKRTSNTLILKMHPMLAMCLKGMGKLPQNFSYDITKQFGAKRSSFQDMFAGILSIQDERVPYKISMSDLVRKFGLETEYSKNTKRVEEKVKDTLDGFKQMQYVKNYSFTYKGKWIDKITITLPNNEAETAQKDGKE